MVTMLDWLKGRHIGKTSSDVMSKMKVGGTATGKNFNTIAYRLVSYCFWIVKPFFFWV